MPVPMPQFNPDIPVYDGEAMPGLVSPSIPTVAAAPVALAAKGAQGTRCIEIILGVAGLVAGAAALVVVLRSRAAPDGPERVIVVDSRTGASSAGSPVEPGDELPDAASQSLPPSRRARRCLRWPRPRTHAEGNGGHEGSAEALSRVMAGRQDLIAKCFEARAADVSGAPGLSVHFEVDVNGQSSPRTCSPRRSRPRRSASASRAWRAEPSSDLSPARSRFAFR